MLGHGHSLELGESLFKIIKFQGVRPVVLVGSAKNFENLEDLVNFTITHEKRPSLDHFCENAASRPQINPKGICFLPEQDLWAPVPKCNYLVRVGLDW